MAKCTRDAIARILKDSIFSSHLGLQVNMRKLIDVEEERTYFWPALPLSFLWVGPQWLLLRSSMILPITGYQKENRW